MHEKICDKFEKASKLLGKPWVAMIVYQLLDGPKRFSALSLEINISAKMLSERLKMLEHLDIILRTVFSETPVRIEYQLTKKGYALKPIMDEIAMWSTHWSL